MKLIRGGEVKEICETSKISYHKKINGEKLEV